LFAAAKLKEAQQLAEIERQQAALERQQAAAKEDALETHMLLDQLRDKQGQTQHMAERIEDTQALRAQAQAELLRAQAAEEQAVAEADEALQQQADNNAVISQLTSIIEARVQEK
jgi:hypothetical protein